MKIICIGRNYGRHALELGNAIPSEPVVFMKPSTALTVDNKPLFLPDFSSNVHYEIELVLKVCKHGKAIEQRFAHRYYDAIGLGIDFTARDLQDELKSAGLPWEKAKSFDGSAAVGQFVPVDALPNPEAIKFTLQRNGEVVQTGDSADMLFSFDSIIAHVSTYFKLMKGDLIFTGTPAGVGRVERNDHLVGELEGRVILDMRVK